MSAARLAEWAHRTTFGPEYAPGDVVEVRCCHYAGIAILERPALDGWFIRDEEGRPLNAVFCDEFRVVRYGEGE
jgi:hypothetical protein